MRGPANQIKIQPGRKWCATRYFRRPKFGTAIRVGINRLMPDPAFYLELTSPGEL